MADRLDDVALAALFRDARTHSTFAEREVSDEVLRELVDLLKMGPTSANSSPARFVFVKSAEAKARLVPLMFDSNRERVEKAPVTAIIGQDLRFYDHLPKLFPHVDAKSWFEGNEPHIKATAFRNSSLQGAYLILAARALGLSCGPMSGFDAAGVDREFFAGTSVAANFVVNLGYDDGAAIRPRAPRFSFSEMAQIV